MTRRALFRAVVVAPFMAAFGKRAVYAAGADWAVPGSRRSYLSIWTVSGRQAFIITWHVKTKRWVECVWVKGTIDVVDCRGIIERAGFFEHERQKQFWTQRPMTFHAADRFSRSVYDEGEHVRLSYPNAVSGRMINTSSIEEISALEVVPSAEIIRTRLRRPVVR